MVEIVGVMLVLGGTPFFLAGTVGILRFPDSLSRLHALTKADNVGLGLVALGLAVQAETLLVAVKILLVWLLVLVSSAVVSHLLAAQAVRDPGEGDA